MEKSIKLNKNNVLIDDINYDIKAINRRTETSYVFITIDNQYIFKKVRKYYEYDIFEREVYLLNLLNQHVSWVPKLIAYDNDEKIIMTEYCGLPLNKNNKPSNFKKQIKQIKIDLKKLNIQHNDLKINEEEDILVKDDKIFICDWGWGSINNEHSCGIHLWNGKKPHSQKQTDEENLIELINNN